MNVPADMNETMRQERLWKAAQAGDSKTIRLLAAGEEPLDIDARNPEGFTAFNLATAAGHADAAMTILAIRELQRARKMGLDPVDFFRIPAGGTLEKSKPESDSRKKRA